MSEQSGEMERPSAHDSQEMMAGDLMEPLPARLALHHSVAAARELMWAAGMSYLIVVAPVTGKLLGVVLRRILEKGCESRGHDPEQCPLVRHLSTDFDFVFEGELIREIFGDAPTTLAAPGEGRTPELRRRNAIPVIVVDEWKVPIGLLRRPRGKVVLNGRGGGENREELEDEEV
ncbi:MAG: hypothetical protein LBG44_05850 [Gemmatimonadota bacterium]|nr:hypothetical protein [Gemmatimonadota bacterium]